MDLSVILSGHGKRLVLKNPLLAASGTFGNGLEFAPFGNLADLGGFVVKGLSLKSRPGNPMPRIAETPAGMLNSIGLQNEGVDRFLTHILPQLPTAETAVIVNIYGSTLEEIGELAARLNGVEGIAGLELNVSCPNVKAGGAIFGSSAELCHAAVEAARENAPDKFLIVKLSPNVTNIVAIAESAEDAGADCISCINTLLGMGIDSRSRKPLLANIVGGLSGPAIKPVALRCVWQVARAVKVPIIGVGGIMSATDILEFLLAGASAVEIGTANFMRPDAAFVMAAELPALLVEQGVSSPAELIGALVTD